MPRTPNLSNTFFQIMNTLSFSVEVFTRHSFGERYVNWLRFIFTLITLQMCLNFLRFFHALPWIGGGIYPHMSSFFWYSFLGLSGFHLFQIWQRNRRNIPWHSRSLGISHLAFLPVNDTVLFRWVEPLTCMTVSSLLYPFSPFTANWLLMSSVALLIKNNLIFNAMRGRVLDVVDGRIEAAIMAGKLEGKDKRETAGWSTVVTIPDTLDVAGMPETSGEADSDDFADMVAALMEGDPQDDASEAADTPQPLPDTHIAALPPVNGANQHDSNSS